MTSTMCTGIVTYMHKGFFLECTDHMMSSTGGEEKYIFYCRKVSKGKNKRLWYFFENFLNIFANTIMEIFTITFANTLIDEKICVVYNTLTLCYLCNILSWGTGPNYNLRHVTTAQHGFYKGVLRWPQNSLNH